MKRTVDVQSGAQIGGGKAELVKGARRPRTWTGLFITNPTGPYRGGEPPGARGTVVWGVPPLAPRSWVAGGRGRTAGRSEAVGDQSREGNAAFGGPSVGRGGSAVSQRGPANERASCPLGTGRAAERGEAGPGGGEGKVETQEKRGHMCIVLQPDDNQRRRPPPVAASHGTRHRRWTNTASLYAAAAAVGGGTLTLRAQATQERG